MKNRLWASATQTDFESGNIDVMIFKEFVRILISKKNRILVMKSSYDGRDIWNFPGGKKEPGEDLFSAARREVFEECGICLNEIHFLYTRLFILKGVTWKGYYFYSKNFQGDPHIQEPNKCSEMCFKTKKEIMLLPAIPGTLHEHQEMYFGSSDKCVPVIDKHVKYEDFLIRLNVSVL